MHRGHEEPRDEGRKLGLNKELEKIEGSNLKPIGNR